MVFMALPKVQPTKLFIKMIIPIVRKRTVITATTSKAKQMNTTATKLKFLQILTATVVPMMTVLRTQMKTLMQVGDKITTHNLLSIYKQDLHFGVLDGDTRSTIHGVGTILDGTVDGIIGAMSIMVFGTLFSTTLGIHLFWAMDMDHIFIMGPTEAEM